MSFKQAGEGSDDHRLVVNFIMKELEKPSVTPLRSNTLVKFLVIIHEDAKKGYLTRIEDLASFLRKGLYEAFDTYARTVIENQERKNDQWNDFDKTVLTILSLQEYNSHQSSFFKEMMTAFRKMSTCEILHYISLLKRAHYQLSTNIDRSSEGTQLGSGFFNNMHRWSNNEISGRRCAKNILDSLGTTMGAVFGGTVGAVIRGSMGPLGAAAGALSGAVLGSIIAFVSIQLSIEHLLDLPMSEVEENAYKFFGLSKYASDSQIYMAFRGKMRFYHPDNQDTGDHDKFALTNIHMEVLWMARGRKKWD